MAVGEYIIAASVVRSFLRSVYGKQNRHLQKIAENKGRGERKKSGGLPLLFYNCPIRIPLETLSKYF